MSNEVERHNYEGMGIREACEAATNASNWVSNIAKRFSDMGAVVVIKTFLGDLKIEIKVPNNKA